MSVQYVKSIYQASESFPDHERFGLIQQLRRSAISIPSNIAEGSSRRTASDKKRFLDLAISSLHESHAQLILAFELGYLNDSKISDAEEFIGKLRAKLYAYYRSVQDRSIEE